jgi:hypothetical protein
MDCPFLIIASKILYNSGVEDAAQWYGTCLVRMRAEFNPHLPLKIICNL